ncbi:hypothetical protein L9F63_018078, partial [Diploptera punctata]
DKLDWRLTSNFAKFADDMFTVLIADSPKNFREEVFKTLSTSRARELSIFSWNRTRDTAIYEGFRFQMLVSFCKPVPPNKEKLIQ